MILIILILVIIGLIISLLILISNFKEQKNNFKKKQSKLLDTITSSKQKQISLKQQVKISEEFNINYEKSKTIIAQNIYEANLEFLKNITGNK